LSFSLIAPSVLSCDFSNLRMELDQIPNADIIHLDVMDGHYVPNLSFGYPLIKTVRDITTLPLDVHLMVSNPSDYVDRLADIGVEWISFHQECEYHVHRLVQRIKALGIKAGIALNPAVPLSTLDSILPDLDYVLLMSVNPGFSGQSFIPSVLNKVLELSKIISTRGFKTLIEVDGGVNESNCRQLKEAGADILVAASYIFNSPNYSLAIDTLRNA
jgi:ribulose-phosphate 3-epimerase